MTSATRHIATSQNEPGGNVFGKHTRGCGAGADADGDGPGCAAVITARARWEGPGCVAGKGREGKESKETRESAGSKTMSSDFAAERFNGPFSR